jgi:hypothetical protein
LIDTDSKALEHDMRAIRLESWTNRAFRWAAALLRPARFGAVALPLLPLPGLLLTALLIGCASAPTATNPPSGLDCRQLGAEIERTERANDAAQERKQDAWKVVVPFAVVGRYAQAASAADQADKRLADLNAESARQGCARHGG